MAPGGFLLDKDKHPCWDLGAMNLGAVLLPVRLRQSLRQLYQLVGNSSASQVALLLPLEWHY